MQVQQDLTNEFAAVGWTPEVQRFMDTNEEIGRILDCDSDSDLELQ